MEKILCVDDDDSLLRLYQEELSEEGYKVILAKDGKEALSKFDERKAPSGGHGHPYAVMDGIETLNALLGKDRQCPGDFEHGLPSVQREFPDLGS